MYVYIYIYNLKYLQSCDASSNESQLLLLHTNIGDKHVQHAVCICSICRKTAFEEKRLCFAHILILEHEK